MTSKTSSAISANEDSGKWNVWSTTKEKQVTIMSTKSLYNYVCIRDVIKDDFGGKLPSGRPPASAFTPRTGLSRLPTR
jgi:hypothetical protein